MSATDCLKLDYPIKEYCTEIYKSTAVIDDKLNDIQTQIYIVSGVLGGVALILIIILIALAIALGRLRQQTLRHIGNSNVKNNPTADRGMGMTSRNVPFGNNSDASHLRQPVPHSLVQAPTPMMPFTSEQELAQRGFSAYTGHPIESRGQSASPVVNSAGGVRVLPRNPPTGFRGAGAFNEGYNM